LAALVPYEEKELILRIAEGDQQAFKILYDHYVKHVYGIAVRLMKSPDLAQDLTQEIFARVWIKRASLATVQQFRPWLNTITKNLARDYLRKKVVAPEYESYLLGFFADLSPSVEEELAHRQLQHVMREAIDQLSPQLKTAFTLSRFKGLTHEQIAAEMQISPTTSKSHLVRALASIRSYLKKHYPEVAIVVTVLLMPRG
jgi:RNA polymerase sigma-70 factor (family 1)